MGGTASVSGGQVPNGIIQVGQGFFVRGLEFGINEVYKCA